MDKQQQIDSIKARINELTEIWMETWEKRERYEERGYLEAYHEAAASLFNLGEHIDELEAQLQELTGTAENF